MECQCLFSGKNKKKVSPICPPLNLPGESGKGGMLH